VRRRQLHPNFFISISFILYHYFLPVVSGVPLFLFLHLHIPFIGGHLLSNQSAAFFAFALHLGPPLQLHPGPHRVRALDTEINITRISIAVPVSFWGTQAATSDYSQQIRLPRFSST
jgi:hypothetical protein